MGAVEGVLTQGLNNVVAGDNFNQGLGEAAGYGALFGAVLGGASAGAGKAFRAFKGSRAGSEPILRTGGGGGSQIRIGRSGTGISRNYRPNRRNLPLYVNPKDLPDELNRVIRDFLPPKEAMRLRNVNSFRDTFDERDLIGQIRRIAGERAAEEASRRLRRLRRQRRFAFDANDPFNPYFPPGGPPPGGPPPGAGAAAAA